ncbi:PaaI family thioesterase [Pseudomonas alliivorans]|nr:PaaI family thioesterase [Pseudomonas alliivorans]MEE5124827.1 PaaI family thioesterase [Pseudomonas alliivorans]MEE5163038.1 PaaI family thioesterase [Pseudomonas alliivorans]
MSDSRINSWRVGDQHRNALGGVHGGVIFSLADVVFAAACNAGDAAYIRLQAEVRYINGVKRDQLHAIAILMTGSRKFAHYQVVITDDLNNRVALFTATAYRLDR